MLFQKIKLKGDAMRRRDFLKQAGAITGGIVVFGNAPLFSAFAQSKTPKRGGTLIWGHSETTQNLDIHQTGTASTTRFLVNLHEPIVKYDRNFNIVPGLAERFKVSDDGKTYTFVVRKNVKFHNGKTLTATDVKYTYERIMNPDTGATTHEVFNNVQEVVVLDTQTVQLKMKKIHAPLLARLAYTNIAIIPEGSGETQGSHPIGSGPFKFAGRVMGSENNLERFKDYWGKPAYLDAIHSVEVTEATVRLTGLRTGEFHFINDVPMDRIAEVQKESNLQTQNWDPVSFAFLNFNHKVKPFDDPRVRLAFDYCIDKETLQEGAIWSQGEVTTTFSYPGAGDRNNNLKARGQDFDKARSLLKEAGAGNLEFTFKVTTNYPWHVDATQIMVEWFRVAGMKIKIAQLNWSDWLAQCWTNRDFDVTMMNFFGLWEPDFLYYSLWHTDGGFNYRNISDSKVDELCEQARATIDVAKRDKIYHKVQQRIFDEAHDVFLWRRKGWVAARKNVGGLDKLVDSDGNGFNFKNVWLES
jgi:ABC-type transport system substrate-binding protein